MNPYAPSRIADKFVIRLEPGQRGRLADTADRNFRSMNSEVLCALEWWMTKQEVLEALQQAMQTELERLRGLPTPQP